MRRNGLISLIFIVVLAGAGMALTLVAGNEPLLGLDLQGGVSVVYEPAEATDDESLDQAIAIIRQRIDAIGVAEPEITRQGDAIIVQVPGVKDRERVLELVGQTAELRFRPVLGSLPPGDTTEGDEESEDTTTTTGADESTTTTAGDNTTTTTASTTTTAPADGSGGLTTREEDVPEAPVVLAQYGEEGQEEARYRLGPVPGVETPEDNPETLPLTGEILSDARAELVGTGQWVVSLEIKGDRIDDFNAISSECFNGSANCPPQGVSDDGAPRGRLAIALDGRVESAPTINSPSFAADQISISGSFDEGAAKDLALVLRYGALPVELEAQQTQTVSASLGKDALDAGVTAGIIGLALVALYMLVYYRLLGLVAILSLGVSATMLWTVIAYLGESQGLALTLAGVTGIIVSIGIAVDSNVVFYEHLKEGVWKGRTLRTAVDGSFRSAFSTIVKADVASLIGAGILYFLTIGPVRGFALYLGLSTVLDLIASYFFMRPLTLMLARSGRLQDRPHLSGMPRGTGELSKEGAPA